MPKSTLVTFTLHPDLFLTELPKAISYSILVLIRRRIFSQLHSKKVLKRQVFQHFEQALNE
jgi:hypothetical protein